MCFCFYLTCTIDLKPYLSLLPVCCFCTGRVKESGRTSADLSEDPQGQKCRWSPGSSWATPRHGWEVGTTPDPSSLYAKVSTWAPVAEVVSSVYFCALGWTLSRHPTASIWLRWSFWRTSTTCRPSWVWLKPSSSPGLLNMAEESQWNWCYTTMSWVPSAFLVTIKTMNKVTTNIVYSLSYFYYHYMISERVKREKINVWLIGIICFSKPCYIMSL